MTACPVCKGSLDLDKLIAPALDTYRGKMFAYAHCRICGILVLQNPLEQTTEVDYSDSGYYNKTEVKWTFFLDKIIALYTSHQVSITRHAMDDNSLSGKRLLDIGCGKGRFLACAQERGAVVSGVEPTRRSYEVAKARLNDLVKNVTMSKNLFAGGTFDVITMWHVFEHIPDPLSMLDMCHFSLKSNGKLIVAVPNYSGIIARLGGAVWLNLDPPRHLIHYDVPSLANLLNKSGFEVTKVNHFYPELTYLSALQTLLNKIPITNNFLFNYLKKNYAGLPNSRIIYYKDMMLTAVFSLLFAPVIFITVSLFSVLRRSDCITLVAQKK